MSALERAAWWFDQVSECLQQSFLSQGQVLVDAAECLANALIQEHRILICGNGGSASNAQAFSTMLLNRYHRERPALPAMLLTPDLATFSAIVGESSFADVFARSVRAFGREGDILVCLSATGQASNIMQAIEAAHEQEMPVIALTGYDGGDVIRMLRAEDYSINVQVDRHALIHSTHLCMLQSLAHLIDDQLFGEDELETQRPLEDEQLMNDGPMEWNPWEHHAHD